MRKTTTFLVIIMILLGIIVFSGCTNQVLYGSWQLQETTNLESGMSDTPMFQNIMVFTINKDGTVFFVNKKFGEYTKSRNDFHFVQTSDSETMLDMHGAWEIIGGDLYIRPNDTPVEYHFAKVVKSEE
ncbi:MAG: hypothetical protein KAQ68_04205 [Clostridiales bacterium]|nr:hypothetical protein [Clostridiales bacterium]